MGGVSACVGDLATTKASLGTLRIVVLTTAFASLLLVGASAKQLDYANQGAPSNLCLASEVTLANCHIGIKIASVCGREGRAMYRFGRSGAIELEAGGLTFANRAFAGGGEGQIHFVRGAYRYVFYDRTTSSGFDADGHSIKAFQTGLIVRKHGRMVFGGTCDPEREPFLDSNKSSNFMPTGNLVQTLGS